MECVEAVAGSLPPPWSQPRSHLAGDSVILEEFLGTRKLHCFTLDDEEINPFNRIVEQFRPPRDLLVVPGRGSSSTIKGLQRLKGSDHFSARCEIGCGCLLLDLNGQRVVWIIQGHHTTSSSKHIINCSIDIIVHE
jgi:hypothetical protein